MHQLSVLTTHLFPFLASLQFFSFSALCFCISASGRGEILYRRSSSHPVRVVLSLLDWRLGGDLGLIRLLTALDSVLKLVQVFEVCAISLQIQPLSWQLLWCHPVSLALQEKLFQSTLTLMICKCQGLPKYSSKGQVNSSCIIYTVPESIKRSLDFLWIPEFCHHSDLDQIN